MTTTLKLLDQQSRLPSYTTKIETKVALYRHNLKITTHSKILPHLIRVTAKYQINVSKTLKITQQMKCIYVHLIDTKNYQRMIIVRVG